MLVSENVTRENALGQIITKHIDDPGTSDFRAVVKCEDCGVVYTVRVANRKCQYARNPAKQEFCASCQRAGERNHSYGKDRRVVLAHARKFQKVNGMKGNHHTPESRQLMSKIKAEAIASGAFNILSNNRGTKSWYHSTKTNTLHRADSNLERAFMMVLDNDSTIDDWTKKHNIRLPYTFDGVIRTYVPDFKLKKTDGSIQIIEVKGRMIDVDFIKEQALIEYCIKQGYTYRLIRMSDVPNYKQLLKDMKCKPV